MQRMIRPMELGVMFWPWYEPLETIRELKAIGATCGQLGMPGEADLGPSAALDWRAASEAEAFPIATVFAGYQGESYANMDAVEKTVGFVPFATREARLERTLRLSDFARILGAPSIACPIGVVPENAADGVYTEVREMVRRVCDHAAGNRQTFALETGQERAEVLRQFVESVARPNLRINFDPANLILYGTGDPLEAIDVLAPWIASVHAKDGDWPAQAGALGEERRLGEGAAEMDRFVAKLREHGYDGGLFVEREVENLSQRLGDLRHGIDFLQRILGVQ